MVKCIQTYIEREKPKRIYTKTADRYLYFRASFIFLVWQYLGITYNKVVSKCYTPNGRLCLTQTVNVYFSHAQATQRYHQKRMRNFGSRQPTVGLCAPGQRQRLETSWRLGRR